MKKMKKWLLILAATCSTLCLGACATSGNKGLEVTFVDEYDIPAVRLGVEYDFEPYFTQEKGVTYSMSAMYIDDDLNEVELDVDGFKFTHNEFSDVFVTITATKGSETITGEITIPVDAKSDPTDYWVVDSLYAGDGMSKTLNYLPAYRTSLDSLTSAKFTYRGTAKKDSPVTVMSMIDWPSNSRLTVTDWSNAVITMDVYNSSAKSMTIGLMTSHTSGISYTFDQCDKFVCEPNEWTHIEYSLKALNLTEEFVFNHEWDLSDKILIQSVYDGANEAESTNTYSYNFYVDNVDICDYSQEKFPNLDTTTYKEYEDMFTADDTLSGVVNSDYDNKQNTEDLHDTTHLVEYSNKSIKFVLSEDGSQSEGFLHSFIGGAPTGWKPLDITDATISFYIRTENADSTFALRFESDYNVFARPIEIDLTKTSGEGWTVTEENGWYKVEIDVDQTNVETALVRMDFIRMMRLYFTNATATAGSESAVYLDTLRLEGWKVTDVPLDKENPWDTKSPYTAAEDNDMFSTDENLVLNVNYERVDTMSAASVSERVAVSSYSYKLTLSEDGSNTSVASVDSFFTGKPMGWKVMDVSNAKVSFSVKNLNADNVFHVSFASDFDSRGLILGAKVAIDLTQASGEGWTVDNLGEGWFLVTLDLANAKITDDVVGVTKDFIKIMRIEFSNAAATAGSESAIYIDHLNVVGCVETSVALDEESPWDTKSPYVNYVVTFKNADGSIISQTNYHYGDTVVVPENPSMPGGENECTFTFLGWDYEVTAVNCDATYTATYSMMGVKDLWNCAVENGGIDTIANDTEVKSENSAHSLNIVEPITSGNLPYFALTLDKAYDLTGKYIVFDFKDIEKDGWLVGFDFVNNGSKVGLWNMHTLKSGEKSASHKCEDLSDGWIRVYVDVDALSSSVGNVTAIYFTLNASDGSGALNLHFDNLHFEEKPEIPTYTITFKDYDGRVISSAEYDEGATVVVPENPTRDGAGECTYTFAGWDYAVTTVNCDATYTATYTVANVSDLWNCDVENGGIDSLTNDTEVKSENSAHSLKIVEPISSGNLPYFAITLDKNYDLTGKYMVFDTNISKDGWLVVFDFVNNGTKLGLWNMLTLKSGTAESTHKCEDLGNGWIRVYVDADVLNGSLNSVSKIYVTLNASDGSGTLEFNLDNLHFETKSTTPTPEEPTLTEADDSIGACGLVAVNGGSASIVTDMVSSNSEKSAKFNVPANNSGVWWNYDVDVTSVLGGGLNLVGKTITFDVKIVGNMTWVGFTVADGNGTYQQVNGEGYAWMNLSNGWSGFGMSITAIENGWFRVSFTADTKFSGCSGNVTKLRFLVNPSTADEASMYIDNLYLS